MKKIFIVLAIILNACFLKAEISMKLIEAIQDCNFKKYEQYIKEEKITAEKKQFLKNVIDDVVKTRRNSLAIYKSGKDVLRILTGSSVLTAGLIASLITYIEYDPDDGISNIGAVSGLVGTIALLIGLNQIYKGFTLTSAYKKYNNALLIKENLDTLQVIPA